MSLVEHARSVHRKLWNPPNAKPDHGINMRNGNAIRYEPPPPPVPPPPKPWPGLVDMANTDDTDPTKLRLNELPILLDSLDADGNPLPPAPKPFPVQRVQSAVCRFYKISLGDLLSQRRQAYLIRPRHIAIYLTKTLIPSISYPAIGRRFGDRDHTTILYAVRKIAEDMQTDERLRDEIEVLMLHLKGAV